MIAPAVIAPAGIPRTDTTADLLRAAVEYGVLAPSTRNTQPWRFDLKDGVLLLSADVSRGLPVADPQRRELVMSCGAALFNIRTVLQHWGRVPRVQLLPDPHQPDLLARVGIAPGFPSGDFRALVAAMGSRRTHRAPFAPQPLPVVLLDRLVAIALQEGAWLAVLEGKSVEAVAELIGMAAFRQFQSPEYREETARWTRWGSGSAFDGIPPAALGFRGVGSMVRARLRRWWDGGRVDAARDQELARQAPALVVLGAPGDSLRHWLMAGQALQHVLLVAAHAGVSASFLNHPIQQPEYRRWLVDASGVSGAPQALLRLGYAVQAVRTPRRPVADVLTRR